MALLTPVLVYYISTKVNLFALLGFIFVLFSFNYVQLTAIRNSEDQERVN
jgi:hypothetical protein